VFRYSRARECQQGLGFSVLYASMVFCFSLLLLFRFLALVSFTWETVKFARLLSACKWSRICV
jgi:hypothetical protein